MKRYMAGRIPQDTIDQILNETDIVDVVSRYVRLEKKGGSLFGLCPFHSEKTPSFSVSPAKRIFYCFGCHKGGNAIKFISEIEHVPFREAVQTLADAAGIEIRLDEDESYRQRREAEQRLRQVLLESARFFYRTLSVQEGNEAKRYLLGRGISVPTQRAFGLGYAPDAWDRLTLHLREKGIAETDAIAAGVCQRASNGRLIDVFRNRLMIPIFDFLGQIVAFGGRAMGEEKAKYINSKETELYTKGRHLFAMNLAKKQKDEALIVTEGYFDAISLHAAGLTTAVALLGTAMSSRQAQLLAQMDRPVTLCLDADEAGINASLRALELLRQKQVFASVVTVPEFKDPDLYIRKNGASRFKALLETKMDELDFKLRLIEKQARQDDGELDVFRYQREATDLLAAEENAVMRELKAELVARVLHASPAAVQEEVARKRRNEAETAVETPRPKPRASAAQVADETYVLLALSNNPDLQKTKGFALEEEDFLEEGFRPFFESMQGAMAAKRYSYQYLLSLVEEAAPELADALLAAAIKSEQADGGTVMYRRAVAALKVRRFEREKHALLEAIEQAQDEEARKPLQNLLKEASEQYNTWRQKRI